MQAWPDQVWVRQHPTATHVSPLVELKQLAVTLAVAQQPGADAGQVVARPDRVPALAIRVRIDRLRRLRDDQPPARVDDAARVRERPTIRLLAVEIRPLDLGVARPDPVEAL